MPLRPGMSISRNRMSTGAFPEVLECFDGVVAAGGNLDKGIFAQMGQCVTVSRSISSSSAMRGRKA